MILRSFLFVPADSEKKLSKVDACGADAVILDLEDAVAPERKTSARVLLGDFLAARPQGARSPQLWVRINPLATEAALRDLAAVMPMAPDGIMLPKCSGPEELAELDHYLSAFEAAAGNPVGNTRTLPLVSETAEATLNINRYAGHRFPRLYGLTWGAEDLSADLAASDNRDGDGQFAFAYRHARAQTLLAARALGVEPVETLHADFRDEAGLRSSSRAARSEGFSGRLAIHPAQVPVINESFLPSAEEATVARRIVEAFEAAPEHGTVAVDGVMYDRPHLQRAQQTLALLSVRGED